MTEEEFKTGFREDGSSVIAKGPFSHLDKRGHDIIEALLTCIWKSGEWEDEHEDVLAQWRADRGAAAKNSWRWWVGELDCEFYADVFDERLAAITKGRSLFADEVFESEIFQIIEARVWADNVKDGDDVIAFAETRNKEVIRMHAND
jgi:hypothetical protein